MTPKERPTERGDADAKKVAIPETYVKRVLDYAKQGHTSIEFPTYDTTGTPKRITPSPVKTPTTRSA